MIDSNRELLGALNNNWTHSPRKFVLRQKCKVTKRIEGDPTGNAKGTSKIIYI